MPTVKYYLNNAAADYGPPTTRGTWNDGTPLVEKKCSTTKDAEYNPADSGAQGGDGTANHNYMMMRFVSPALAAAAYFDAGGAWAGVIGLYSQSGLNDSLCIHAWVTQGDSSVVRGTLINNYVDPDVASASATTCGEGCNGTVYENVDAQVGDRLVLEIGMKRTTTHTTYYCYERLGGSNAADLVDGGNGNTYPGWLQFAYSVPAAAFTPRVILI